MVRRGTDGFLGQPGAQGCGNFGVVLGAGCFLLPPVQEGFQPINGPWGTPQMGLMQAGKEGCRLETSQEDTSPPRPPPLCPQERKPKHTWDWCARTQPIPRQPGASSPPAPGFSVHHDKGAHGPKLSSSNGEESQHQGHRLL